MPGFEDKVAIVTGAGSAGPGSAPGIGHTIATALAERGASLLVVDRDPERAMLTVDRLEQLGGRGVKFVGDVTKSADCAAMVKTAVDTFGGLDILVNNAAVTNHASITETSEELYDETLAVNLKGTFLACQQAIPALIERGSGAIVNIGSVVGIRDAGTGQTAYAASKAGQLGLTVELAGAYGGHNIRVNAVLPGLISSAMLQSVSTRVDDVQSKLNLLGRMGEVQDVANAVCFLCSDEANYITGVTLAVDGGASVGMQASAFRKPN